MKRIVLYSALGMVIVVSLCALTLAFAVVGHHFLGERGRSLAVIPPVLVIGAGFGILWSMIERR